MNTNRAFQFEQRLRKPISESGESIVTTIARSLALVLLLLSATREAVAATEDRYPSWSYSDPMIRSSGLFLDSSREWLSYGFRAHGVEFRTSGELVGFVSEGLSFLVPSDESRISPGAQWESDGRKFVVDEKPAEMMVLGEYRRGWIIRSIQAGIWYDFFFAPGDGLLIIRLSMDEGAATLFSQRRCGFGSDARCVEAERPQ